MFVSVKDAALMLGKSEAWVKSQAKAGKLPAKQVLGYNNRLVWQIELHGLQPFETHLEAFLYALQTGSGFSKPYSPKTIKQHRLFLGLFFKWADCPPSLKNVNVFSLKKALNYLCETSVCAYSRKDNLLKTYSCFAKWLIAQGLADSSILEGLKALKPKRFLPARRTKLTKAKLQTLFALVEQHFETPYI